MKTRILTLLAMIGSLVLSSCSPFPYSYTYPKEYSAEYCFEQYELFDPNIVHSECYEFVSAKNWGGLMISVNFSAIKDCEDLSFMVYYKKYWLVGSGHSIQVVRSKASDINPSTDYTPLRAELFWYNGRCPDPDADKEKYHRYDSQCLSQTVMSFDSMETINEIMNIASRNTVLSYDEFLQEQDATINESELRGIYTEDGTLYVKVCFAECEGLEFIGKIMIDDDNNSYMQHIVYFYHDYENISDAVDLKESRVSDGSTWSFYYRLGENMDEIISELIEELSGS